MLRSLNPRFLRHVQCAMGHGCWGLHVRSVRTVFFAWMQCAFTYGVGSLAGNPYVNVTTNLSPFTLWTLEFPESANAGVDLSSVTSIVIVFEGSVRASKLPLVCPDNAGARTAAMPLTRHRQPSSQRHSSLSYQTEGRGGTPSCCAAVMWCLFIDACTPVLGPTCCSIPAGSWGPFMLRSSDVASQCVELQQDPGNSGNQWLQHRTCDTRSSLQQFKFTVASRSLDQFGRLQVNGMCVQAPSLAELKSSAPVRVTQCSAVSSQWKRYNRGWFVDVTTGACLSFISSANTKVITAKCGASGSYMLMCKPQFPWCSMASDPG